MSYPLVAAAVLTVGIGLAHSILGERYIITRLMRRELPHLFGSDWFTKQTIRFAWHLTTVAFLGFAAVLLILADHFGDPAPSVAALTTGPDIPRMIRLTIAVVFGVSAVVAAAASRFKHLAWPVFTAIAVLTWFGV